jgi:hypothetical protein
MLATDAEDRLALPLVHVQPFSLWRMDNREIA